MNSEHEYMRGMEPILTARECGGWMAIAPRGAALRIAVIAETADEARKKFSDSLGKWVENLDASD